MAAYRSGVSSGGCANCHAAELREGFSSKMHDPARIPRTRRSPALCVFGRGAERATNSAVRRVSAANFVEAAVIIDASRDPVASRRFDDLIKEAQIIIEPVTEPQARIARDAYRDFGKGSGHPAKLNFGDCFAYALAKSTGEPLLFKGGRPHRHQAGGH